MAVTCDSCGKLVEGEPMSIAIDHTEGRFGNCNATDWFYYCEGDCADNVKGQLDNMRRYVHEGAEVSGLEWRLVERDPPEREEAASPSKRPVFRDDEEEDAQQRKEQRVLRLPLSWYFEKLAPDRQEIAAREEEGTPLRGIITHTGSLGKMHKVGLATLEDVAKMSRVEFHGSFGVGARIAEKVEAAMKRKKLAFAAGPSAGELGDELYWLRNNQNEEVENLAEIVCESLEIPVSFPSASGDHSRAYRDVVRYITDAERGKPMPPQILTATAKALDSSVADLFAHAAERTSR